MTISSEQAMPARIASHLREQIIMGALPMGSRLNEREIAEHLDVSRVPVREALPILETEGFITSLPRRMAVVHTLTAADAEEVFDLRLQLEPLAAELAALRVAQGADPQGLLQSLNDAHLSPADHSPSARNSDLHEEIILLSGHALLTRITGLLSGRVRWLFQLTPERDTASMWQQHKDIVDAILAGEHQLAKMLATAHVERGRIESMPLLTARLPAATPVKHRGRSAAAPA